MSRYHLYIFLSKNNKIKTNLISCWEFFWRKIKQVTYSFFQASFPTRSDQEIEITLTMRNEIGRRWRICTRGGFFMAPSDRMEKGVGCHRGEYEGWKQSSRWMALFAWHSRKTFVLLWILMLRARKNFSKKASSGSCESSLCLTARIEQTRWNLDTRSKEMGLVERYANTVSSGEICGLLKHGYITKIHHCFSIMEYIYNLLSIERINCLNIWTKGCLLISAHTITMTCYAMQKRKEGEFARKRSINWIQRCTM